MATTRLDARIEFRTAAGAGFHLGTSDPDVLAVAARAGCVLVTHDRRTMPTHFERFIAEDPSPGVILVSRSLSIGRAAEWLHLVWATSDAAGLANSISFIP